MADAKKPMTEKQRQARLENIKNARGPKTPAGKKRSSRNATKHGGWSRGLYPILYGPLREDPAELDGFVNAYLDEFKPGGGVVLRQAVLDLADKAWRLTRAQRWEAQGHSSAEYVNHEAANADWLRFLANEDRRRAEVVGQFPDPAVSDEDLEGVLYTLGFAVGIQEEDLYWVEEADRAAVVEALATLISEHFTNQKGASEFLEARAEDRDSEASETDESWRAQTIRQEIDGSFARNAERLVAHASREYDRALRRYEILADRFGDSGVDQTGEGDDPGQGDGGAAQQDRMSESKPAPNEGGSADEFDIFSRFTADEVVDYLTNLPGTMKSSDPLTRNEPTEGGSAM